MRTILTNGWMGIIRLSERKRGTVPGIIERTYVIKKRYGIKGDRYETNDDTRSLKKERQLG